MKPTHIYGIALAASGLILASCTQIPARVNDRPYGVRTQHQQPVVPTPTTATPNPLDQWNQPTGFPGQQQPGTVATATPGVTPTTTTTPTISVIPDPPKPVISTTPGVTQPAPGSSITSTQPVVTPSQHPVAVPVPGNPLEVYSPSDRNKTIRIVDKKTGQRQPSGKKLYDPYSPGGKGIFIVP